MQLVQQEQACNLRSNYNAFRQTSEDFEVIIKTQKILFFSVEKNRVIQDWQSSDAASKDASQSVLKRAHKQVSSRVSQNSAIYENEAEGSECNLLGEGLALKQSAKAHKDVLTHIDFLPINKFHIVTASTDQYIKIWDYQELRQVCSLHLEHPLPLQWNLQMDRAILYKMKILFALKSMKCVIEKYRQRMTLVQEKVFNFTEFFAYLLEHEPGAARRKRPTEDAEQEVPESAARCAKSVILMRDEYSPRDLIYEKIKSIYAKELLGPSLKYMNDVKKSNEAQIVLQQDAQETTATSASKHLNQMQDDKNKDYKYVSLFLDPTFKQKAFNKQQAQFVAKTDLKYKVEKQLDQYSKQPTHDNETSMHNTYLSGKNRFTDKGNARDRLPALAIKRTKHSKSSLRFKERPLPAGKAWDEAAPLQQAPNLALSSRTAQQASHMSANQGSAGAPGHPSQPMENFYEFKMKNLGELAGSSLSQEIRNEMSMVNKKNYIQFLLKKGISFQDYAQISQQQQKARSPSQRSQDSLPRPAQRGLNPIHSTISASKNNPIYNYNQSSNSAKVIQSLLSNGVSLVQFANNPQQVIEEKETRIRASQSTHQFSTNAKAQLQDSTASQASLSKLKTESRALNETLRMLNLKVQQAKGQMGSTELRKFQQFSQEQQQASQETTGRAFLPQNSQAKAAQDN